jgi:hypothetical protein
MEAEKCIQNNGQNPKGRDNLEDLGIYQKILEKQDGKLWTVFIWLRIGTGSKLL